MIYQMDLFKDTGTIRITRASRVQRIVSCFGCKTRVGITDDARTDVQAYCEDTGPDGRERFYCESCSEAMWKAETHNVAC